MRFHLRTACLAFLLAGRALAGAQTAALDQDRPLIVPMPFADARRVLAAMPRERPSALTGADGAVETAWPRWLLTRHDEIRTRLDVGDVDSLVNLWLYGTSFTRQPRAVERAGQALAADLPARRLEDLLHALTTATDDERLLFAGSVLARHGIDAASGRGRDAARTFLMDARARAQAQFSGYAREFDAAVRRDPDSDVTVLATLFRDRGLSSDTSLLPDFAVDQALEAARANGSLARNGVRRVAVVGPGLDIINKADGHDFAPPQSTQAFALIDSLIRLGLARPAELSVTAFDVSPRVVEHLRRAARRADAGLPYILQLRLSEAERWTPAFTRFWSQFAAQVGDAAEPVPPPATAGTLRVRAMGVRPSVARSVTAEPVNVVLERQLLVPGRRFDLIVATNVLVYYDAFEQALALANIAAMLEPGGVLLTNNLVEQRPPELAWPLHLQVAYSDVQRDHLFLYRRSD